MSRPAGTGSATRTFATGSNTRSRPPARTTGAKVLCLGPDRAGKLLEIVTVLRDDDTEIVTHAMKMRRI
jgi:hypothetical protein